MAASDGVVNHEKETGDSMNKDYSVKVICLGDSAVGKSKLVERFLMDGYKPQQLSTFALTLFQYKTRVNETDVRVDFWDTAGQERFSSMHPSYYHQAHSCLLASILYTLFLFKFHNMLLQMLQSLKDFESFLDSFQWPLHSCQVFDITRKVTYKNLARWYKELREYRENIPCIVVANKIDIDYNVTQKSFNFPKKHGLPFYFVSASDGTNVVRAFTEAIKLAVNYKENSTDFMDQVLHELENFEEMNPNQDLYDSSDKKSSDEEKT